MGALFVATSTWHLYNSRLTNRANAAPFFLSLALYLMFDTIRRLRGGRPYFAWALLAGAVYGLGFHTYTSFRITPLLILAFWAFCLARARVEGLWKRFWLTTVSFAGAAVVTTAPLALYFWKHPEMFSLRTSQVSVLSRPNPGWHVISNC